MKNLYCGACKKQTPHTIINHSSKQSTRKKFTGTSPSFLESSGYRWNYTDIFVTEHYESSKCSKCGNLREDMVRTDPSYY